MRRQDITYAPTILDVEASGFGRSSYPIEIGFVLPDGHAYCTLVRPEPQWSHWDAQAEKLHHISRTLLQARGLPAYEVAQTLNARLQGQTVYTDGWKSYDGLVLGGYKHHRIHHHHNQFARGKNHVNGIESFWSFTKLRLAKLRGIRAEYFFLHLKESKWRWNHRHDNLYLFLLKNLRSEPL